MDNELSRDTHLFLPPDCGCSAIGASCCCCHILPAMMDLPHTVGQWSAFCPFRFSSQGLCCSSKTSSWCRKLYGGGIEPWGRVTYTWLENVLASQGGDSRIVEHAQLLNASHIKCKDVSLPHPQSRGEPGAVWHSSWGDMKSCIPTLQTELTTIRIFPECSLWTSEFIGVTTVVWIESCLQKERGAKDCCAST